MHKRLFSRPIGSLLIFATALGLLITMVWLWVGAPGNLIEIGISLLDTVAIALIHALAAAFIFWYDEDFLGDHPVWSALLVGGALTVIGFVMLATRGYVVQGFTLAIGLGLFGFIAGGLFVLSERPQIGRQWWAVLVVYLVAYSIALQFGEGFEGDYMMESTAVAWAPFMPAALLVSVALAPIIIFARRWMIEITTGPTLPAVLLVITLLLSAGVLVVVGKPQVQAVSFYVIMKDQPDTSSVREISNPKERAQAAYDLLTEHAERTQVDLRQLLDDRRVHYIPTYLVNGVEVYGDPLLRAQIAGRPDVDRILESPVFRPLPTFAADIEIPPEIENIEGKGIWGIRKINADKVHDTLHVTGQGIIVGSADSGVEWTHPALETNFAGSEDSFEYTWFDPWNISKVPDDSIGHGTHTTGIMAGHNGIGVAPGARWIACRSLVHSLGNPPGYIACMQFLFAPFPQDGDPLKDGDPSRGAQVVNSSLGCPIMEGCDDIVLPMALEHLADAGQMNVVAAGNDGPACSTIDSFASPEFVISVGAIGPDGTITDFSSRGPILPDGTIKPDVAAPGAKVWSAVPGGYAALPGTSMAAPHVAGVVALMWSANPDLIGDIETTKQIIEDTAHYMTAPDMCGPTGSGENNVYGFGVVDAYAAVQKALEMAGK
jgi:hypothetical protein